MSERHDETKRRDDGTLQGVGAMHASSADEIEELDDSALIIEPDGAESGADPTMSLDDEDVVELDAHAPAEGEKPESWAPSEAGATAAASGGAEQSDAAALEESPDAAEPASSQTVTSFETVSGGPQPAAEPDHRPGDEAADEEREFFLREARALAQSQPERSALMWIEAARVAEDGRGDAGAVMQDIDAALELRPDSPWLLPRARRQLMRLGRYEAALKLGQREIKLGGDATIRSAVLFEAAAVVRYRLRNAKTALALVEKALQLQPRSIAALQRAATLYGQQGQSEDMAKTLERLAECVTEPRQRAISLYTAATLHEARLGDDAAARSAYARAVESDSQHVPAVMALTALDERTAQWAQLCRSLEQLAELAHDERIEARLLYQSGSLHLDRTADLESAARDLNRAVEADPDNAAAIQRLAYAYEAKGRPRELVRTLIQLLDKTPDTQGRAALLTQVGTVRHKQLHEEDEALDAYRQALEELPGYLPALQALGALYRHRGDYERLVAISNPETEGTLPVGARAVRLVENAEVLFEKLDRTDDAIAAYRRALELMPKQHLAYWGLADVLRKTERYDELSELLAQQAERSEDPQTRTYLLIERARLKAGVLGQIDQAISLLSDHQSEDLTHGTRPVLIDLCMQAGRYTEAVPLLLAQADHTTDPDEAESRRAQAAQLLESELDEQDRALEIYRRILEDNPTNMTAIHGAGRILHRRGAWTDLIKLHHHELTHDPDRADAATLLCRVGRILSEELGNRGAAINAYSRALKQDPSCTAALVALEGLARAEKKWEELVTVLEQYAQARNDGPTAASALTRAADVAGWELGDLDRAAALFEAALERDGSSDLARHGLLRVRLRQERWQDAVELLELLVDKSPSETERCQLQLQLARLKEFRLDQPADIQLYEQAASASYGDRLQEELLRIRWVDPPREMVQRLVELGRRTADGTLSAGYLLEAAHMAEFSEPPDDETEAVENAFERRPDDPAVIWSLERSLMRRGQWAELGELREKEAQLELDRRVRVQRLAQAAEAYWLAGASDDAERVCRECLNFDVHCLPALRLLARIAEDSQQWADLAELCDRLAEACSDSENRLSSCVRAAELWASKVADSSRALASLAVALADNPAEARAFTRAEALLRERGDFDELSRLYQRRIRSCRDDDERVQLLREHARVLRDDCGHPDRAIAELNTLLSIAPDDLGALEELSELHAQRHHWADAAATLGLLVERAPDPKASHHARLKQAEIWLSHLHEPQRARAVLEQALEENPDDLEVKKLQVNLASTVGEWEDARKLLDEVSRQASGSAQIWALLKLAEVARYGMRDDELRDSSERQAVLLAARDGDALGALREHYPTRQQKRHLVETCERVLTDVEGDEAAALRELLAKIFIEDLDEPAKALPHLELLLSSQPGGSHGHIALLMARVLEHQGAKQQAAEQYRTMVAAEPSAVEAYRGLARVADREISLSAAVAVDLLGEPGEHERMLLKTLDDQRLPPGAFAHDQLRLERAEPVLQEVLETLAPYLESLYVAGPGEEIDPTHPSVHAAQQLARCLGLGRVTVQTASANGTARIALGQPIVLQLDPMLVPHYERAVFRFWAGRALASGLQGGVVVQQLDDAQLDELIDAIYSKRPMTPSAQQLKKNLARVLPRKVRKQIEGLQPPSGGFSELRSMLDRKADRLAIVLSGHPGVALRELALRSDIEPAEIPKTPYLAELLRFVMSPDYVQLYRAIWR